MPLPETSSQLTTIVGINGMSCAACTASVETAIRSVSNVEEATVNLATEKATVIYQSRPTILKEILNAVRDSGYSIKTEHITLEIQGMTCAACTSTVEKAMSKLEGVVEVIVSLTKEQAQVSYLEQLTPVSTMIDAVRKVGYNVNPKLDNVSSDAKGSQLTSQTKEISLLKYKFFVSAFVGFILFLGSFNRFPWVNTLIQYDYYLLTLLSLGTLVQFWAGSSFYKSGLSALRNKTANMYTLVCLGTSVAYIYSVVITLTRIIGTVEIENSPMSKTLHFDTAAIIIALVILGRLLERRARHRTSDAIRQLIDLKPNQVSKITGSKEMIIPISELIIGDTVIVKPGERIPVDGEIVDGYSWIDESMISGESIPLEKGPGGQVYSATINTTRSLIIRADRLGQHSILGQIIEMVEKAQNSKIPIQRIVDAFAAHFVPGVIAIAGISFMFWFIWGPEPSLLYSLLTFISILVVACPCAIGLATPTAMIVSTGHAANRGILIKNAETLEKTNKATVVLVDKTGTLTKGKPEVTDIFVIKGTRTELLHIAASVEVRSEHPLGKPIVALAINEGLNIGKPDNFEAFPGLGVKANMGEHCVLLGNQKFLTSNNVCLDAVASVRTEMEEAGKTTILVAKDNQLLGIIGLSDIIKDESAAMVAHLNSLGVETIMVTGDNPKSAQEIARRV
ncbi:heavy metal translocating P-type ATPase, partial [SAR202 cluster bacterium AC-409-J13_OGT_754m]|nr:heavy metal translocating P-type ATPase [SAR202 cluster bacterium AC-409-J13_OGT_754m]